MDANRSQLSGRATLALAVMPISFLALFYVYPIASIIALGLSGAGPADQGGVLETWVSPRTIGVVWFTLWQATVSTVLTVLAALPGAYALARVSFRGRRLLRAAATVPFVLPTVVVASAILALLGPRSPLNDAAEAILGAGVRPVRLDGSIWAILAAHVFFNYAVALRLVSGVWEALDPREEEAARVLGASPWRAFREVTLPLLRPAILSAAGIVFLFTFTSFGVILLLGSPGTATLEVEIYRSTAQLLDLPRAAALSLLQIGGVVVLLLVSGRLGERGAVATGLRAPSENVRPPHGARGRFTLGAILGLTGLFLGLPLAVLVERSVREADGYGLAAYLSLAEATGRTALFVPATEAVRNSLVFALGTTVLASILGLLSAAIVGYRRGRSGRAFDVLLMLPLGTSAVTLGFGFIVALDEPPLALRTSPLLIPLAHTLVAMPFVVRATVPLIRSIEPRLREAAQVLGASRPRVWREIDAPVIARAAAIGAGFAFAVSLGEFGATVFIARPDVPTVPIAIFRLLSQPGAESFAQVMALSTILMLLVAGAIALVEWLRPQGATGF